MLYSQLGTVRLFPKFFSLLLLVKALSYCALRNGNGWEITWIKFSSRKVQVDYNLCENALHISPPPNLAHISLKSCTITLTWHDCRSGSKVIISNTLVQRPYMLFSSIDYICLIPCQIIIGTYPWTKSLPQFSYSVFNFY